MFKYFHSVEFIYYRLLLTRKIRKLNIEKAGKDSEGICFIKLRSDYIFYGPEARGKDFKYYQLLPKKIKSVLPNECYGIALDILTRYIGGGLKLGGPEKQSRYEVRSGDKVAEMGAFRGYYCMRLAKQVGKSGKVIAIEPVESNLFYLRKNIEANYLDQVKIVNKGVWKEKAVMTFQREKHDYQSGSLGIQYSDADKFLVEVDSLDNILQESGISHVDFMIIQLNGVELEALEGLTADKPSNLAIAARYRKGGQLAAGLIRKHLVEKGYKTEIINRDYIFAFIQH
jgi:FkbM family methyltransferase